MPDKVKKKSLKHNICKDSVQWIILQLQLPKVKTSDREKENWSTMTRYEG